MKSASKANGAWGSNVPAFRPFSFLYHDRDEWGHPRLRRIMVYDVNSENVRYGIIAVDPPSPFTPSPARVRLETFREFFAAELRALAQA